MLIPTSQTFITTEDLYNTVEIDVTSLSVPAYYTVNYCSLLSLNYIGIKGYAVGNFPDSSKSMSSTFIVSIYIPSAILNFLIPCLPLTFIDSK